MWYPDMTHRICTSEISVGDTSMLLLPQLPRQLLTAMLVLQLV